MNSRWSFSSSETIDHGSISGSPAFFEIRRRQTHPLNRGTHIIGSCNWPSPHPAAMSLELSHYGPLQRNSAPAMPAMQVRGIQTETNLPPLVAHRILHLLVHVPVCLRSRVRVPRIGVFFVFRMFGLFGIWFVAFFMLGFNQSGV